MTFPLQLTFNNLAPEPEIETLIRDKFGKLSTFCQRIVNCRIVVECPHRHHLHGNQFVVRVYLKVPGEEIVVNRDGKPHELHGDARVAIREAFDTTRRQVEDFEQRSRGEVKAHAV